MNCKILILKQISTNICTRSLDDVAALDKLNVVAVEDQRARHQTLEVECIREVLQRCRNFLDHVVLLRLCQLLQLHWRLVLNL